MIKHLVAVSRIEGPMHELYESFEKTKEALGKRSMGLAAGELFESLLGGSQDHQPASSNETWASFSLRIRLEPDARETFEDALRSLIEERNRLIHSMFLRFDLKSQSECEAMISALDQQHESIKPQYEMLQALLADLASTGKIAQEQLTRYLEGLGDDA
ncbi:MAG: hypothetical protein RIB46_22020 [Pseudomonadales bacterium]